MEESSFAAASTSAAASASASASASAVACCRFFPTARGCRNGEACRFAHVVPPLLPPPLPPLVPPSAASSLSASSSSSAAAAIRIVWPPSLPSPSDAQEAAAALLMLPRFRSEWARASTPTRFADEPPLRQAQIARNCREIGIDLGQAASLRNTLLRSKCPWRFEGSEALREAAATRLEDAVGAFLAAHGVRFRTQAQQQEDARRAGLPPAKTPDFLLLPGEAPLLVNGWPVRWIEVKRFYGTGNVDGLKKWSPVVRAPEQVRLGCGAQSRCVRIRARARPRRVRVCEA
jgi:hypothetical protein